MAEQEFDYIIVGMGVGGLTLGALLAHSGKKVAIFEKHYHPGGYGHTWKEGDFYFCADLHYLWDCGEGQRVHRVLKTLDLHNEIHFTRLNPKGFDRVLGPKVDYVIGEGFDREYSRLSERYPAYRKQLKKYFQTLSGIHREMYELPIGFSFWTVALQPFKFRNVLRYHKKTLEDLFNKYSFPQDLRLILAGQSAIFFAPPKTLSLLAHGGGVGSYNEGSFYPAESFQHIMRTLLKKITSQEGCKGHLNSEIVKIDTEGDRVSSVTTAKGKVYRAKNFVFNGDAQLSVQLIGKEKFPKKYLNKLQYEYGPSVVSLYLGLQGFEPSKYGMADENTYWHPKQDLNQVYDDQLEDKIPPQPYFFFNFPSMRPHRDPIVPKGGHQLVAISPCNYSLFKNARDRSEEEYQKLKVDYADRMIDVLENEFFPDLRKHIVHQSTGSPMTNEDFVAAPFGNCYSTPLDPKNVSFNRANYRSPFKNFFYHSASVSLPGFATQIHFSKLLFDKLTQRSVY